MSTGEKQWTTLVFDSLIAYLFVVLSVSTLSILFFYFIIKDQSIVDKDNVNILWIYFSRKLSIHVGEWWGCGLRRIRYQYLNFLIIHLVSNQYVLVNESLFRCWCFNFWIPFQWDLATIVDIVDAEYHLTLISFINNLGFTPNTKVTHIKLSLRTN